MATRNYVEKLGLEELDILIAQAKKRRKEIAPNPTSINARNNKLGVEKHVTSILQCVKVLINEGALDSSLEFINSQLARLDSEALVENAMNSPARALRGKAAAAKKAAAEAGDPDKE